MLLWPERKNHILTLWCEIMPRKHWSGMNAPALIQWTFKYFIETEGGESHCRISYSLLNCALLTRELGLNPEGSRLEFPASLCEVLGVWFCLFGGFLVFSCFGTGAMQMWCLRLHVPGKVEILGVVNALSKQVLTAQGHLGGRIVCMLAAKM